ncbi:SNF2-related protein [Psychrobacter sp. W2-37-MNA-CIBAN-0211]|uniref:SNF2-related protein n=1 Tax=Psychrobacter sp. W2-37-MNA-CIBAN-0211 TaxID=3140443 RepID=UPI003318DB58
MSIAATLKKLNELKQALSELQTASDAKSRISTAQNLSAVLMRLNLLGKPATNDDAPTGTQSEWSVAMMAALEGADVNTVIYKRLMSQAQKATDPATTREKNKLLRSASNAPLKPTDDEIIEQRKKLFKLVAQMYKQFPDSDYEQASDYFKLLRNAKDVTNSNYDQLKVFMLPAEFRSAFEALKPQAVTPAPVATDVPAPQAPVATDKSAAGAIFDRSSISVAKTATGRQKANNAAVKLLTEVNEKGLTRDDLTTEQIETLAAYTGSGGGMTADDGRKGSAYEYYTPVVLASSLWDLAAEYGFSGGKVLDPSAGTGIFASTSPASAVVDSVELDGISGGIAKVLNDGDRSKTIVSPFEAQAGLIEDDSLDMVITNVPFGDNNTRGANKNIDDCYKKESLENYFILRSLQKIKHGGLAIFITPTSVVSGLEAAKLKLRNKTSLVAEFMGAYRLPTVVFDQTGADVVTDVVVYRKHSREATDQITELYQAGDTDALIEHGVLWDDYLSGLYFKTAGKKFVLGDTIEQKNRWGKMAETVVSTKKTPEIAKMMSKFGDSRIKWDALGAVEAEMVSYQEGDTLFQEGQQLKLTEGRWLAVESEVTDTDREIQELLVGMGSAIDMIKAGTTIEQMKSVLRYSRDTSQADIIPPAARRLLSRSTDKVAPAKQAAAWHCVLAAEAIEAMIAKHDYGYDFYTNQPELTAHMKVAFLDGKNTKLSLDPKQDHKMVALYYNNGTYNDAWRGAIDTEVVDNGTADTYQSVIARIQYENKGLRLSREQLAQVDPNADPMTSDDWFIGHDGTSIIAADDFLIGSLADRLADIDKDIAQATDEQIIAKLHKQKAIARDSVTRINLQKLEIDLRSPLVSAEDKVRFLIQSVHKDAYVSYDEQGKGTPDINVTKSESQKGDKDKLYNRIGDWMAKGTVTIGNITLTRMSEREALDWLAEQINIANIKFDAWVKSNTQLMARLETKTNDDKNLYFTQNADETPIDIAGLNPSLNLHGYQNAFVRRQGRFFGGINGMGVGLGKTFSALASTQHVQNIGAKKKTIFTVPNSVLSNWRKEAEFALESTDDCIFIGLRENGDKFKVSSNKYDEDLIEAVSGKYRKIFMTYEAFKRIRMKDKTVEDYAGYIKNNDAAYAGETLHKADEKAKGMVSDLINRLKMKSNAPFLEDMGVDSIVIDEAHSFKNSIGAPKTDNDIKYLSQPDQSGRGEDAQAKLWYIRNLTGNKDGVQLLTATPVTNSPLEIYSMLSLASGRDTVNNMCGGISGADDFIKVMCQIEEETIPTIDGGSRSQNIFTGIRNAYVLRNVIKSNSTIKNADDVGLSVVIPDRDEVSTSVDLGDKTNAELKNFQSAYQVAKAMEKDNLDFALKNPSHPDSPYNPNSPISRIMAKYGETTDLVAHPFNLIRKMDVMIADSEFSDLSTFYDFDKAQAATAQKVIDQFNKKEYVDNRKRPSPYTDDDMVQEIRKQEDGVSVLKGYKVTSQAKIVLHDGRQRIVVDTLKNKIQTSFEDMAAKEKLSLDVTIPPKLAAMLDNFKSEKSSPRGINPDNTNSKTVKQIIFCDHLFLHNKIKRILVKKGGIKAGKIAIITGQVNNEPDQMLDIQDGFNATEGDNKYQVIIANKKAEVGINLQRGTQAIHHLTTGWTPDSLEQRNGRGARQGNKTEKVSIYHYDADGTFDEFKRTMIDKKDEWITNVLSTEGKNTIEVSGSISRAEQDALIATMGDAKAIAEYQASKDAKDVEARRQVAVKKQKINLETIQEQSDIVLKLKPKDIVDQAIIELINLIRDSKQLYTKATNTKTKEATRLKHEERYNAVKDEAIKKIGAIIAGTTLESTGINPKVAKSAEAIHDSVFLDSTEYKPSDMDYWVGKFEREEMDASYGTVKVVINEAGKYQAAYDEIFSTGVNLINQSIKAANYIAEESGIDSITIPDNAGSLIGQGLAAVVDGIYVEAGAFIIKDNAASAALQNLYIVDDKLEGHYIEEYKRYDEPETKYVDRSSPLRRISLTGSRVVLKTDSRYLEYVKQAARLEDNAHAQDKLEIAVYSFYCPQVAEYRQADTKPFWGIATGLQSTNAGLGNATIGIMLPLSILSTGTPFAKKMIAEYAKIGIDIDVEQKTFTVNDSNIRVEPNAYSGMKANQLFTQHVGDLVKQHKVKLVAGDEELLTSGAIIYTLTKPVDGSFVDIVESVAKANDDKLDGDSIRVLISELYDKHLFDDTYMTDKPSDKNKEYVTARVYSNNGDGSRNSYNLIEMMRTIGEQNIKAKKRAKMLEGLKDSDVVKVGGHSAYRERVVIQNYAIGYGVPVSNDENFVFNRDDNTWSISYGAYKKMIEEQPLLATKLTVST